MNQPHRRDIALLFSTRIIRLFCYGFLSVVLALYLTEINIDEKMIGLLFTLTLAGDAGITLWLTTHADQLGRRKTLLIGALLMVGAGAVFVITHNVVILMAAAIIGVISPSGNEIGPFLSLEQAGLTQLIPNERRTQVFAWYNLVGSFATATGALAGGWLAQILQGVGWTQLEAYRLVLMGYGAGGVLILILFLFVSPAIEVTGARVETHALGLHRSQKIVLKLSALFALDAFAGGLIVQSMIAYWFHIKFGINGTSINKTLDGMCVKTIVLIRPNLFAIGTASKAEMPAKMFAPKKMLPSTPESTPNFMWNQ